MVETQADPSTAADDATGGETSTGGGRGAGLAVAAGLVCAVAAGVLLWASEGARVFGEAAFAAVIACF